MIATVEIPSTTLMVKVWDDSAPERAGMPEVEDSFQTTSVYTPVTVGVKVTVPRLAPAAPAIGTNAPVAPPRPL